MSDFMQRYRNARTAIAQIRAGEWIPEYNRFSGTHIIAERGDLELWIGNGPFSCEIKSPLGRHFGLFWRHWVWWAAARRLKKRADSGQHGVPVLA